MSSRLNQQSADGILVHSDRGHVLQVGLTKPADATPGYAVGALFMDQDAAGGLQVYVNEGSNTSCAFKAMASTASGTFATLTATAGTITTGTVTTLTSTTAGITTGNITTANITTAAITNETDAPGASTAAAGNATGNATALPAGTSKFYPTTAADDTKGVIITASDQVTGRHFFVGNGVSNKILKIYPPSGGSINGAAGDAAFSTASGKGAIIYCLSGSGNTWLAW